MYGLGSVISKIAPFLMLPVITRLMPDPLYYGLFDLSNTIISFGAALAVLGMYDSMFRFYFEKDSEDYKKDICSTALFFILGNSVFIFLLMLFFEKEIAIWIFSDEKYNILVYLTAAATLLGAVKTILSAPTRMQNKRNVFLITGTLASVIVYAVAIPLLLNGYYIIAMPLSVLVASLVTGIAFTYMNRHFFSIKRFNLKYLRAMLRIAIPLAPTFLVYWIFNSADRLMIANLLGGQANGIYSIGSKLGLVSLFIYQAFSGGWQYFAFSTMKEENQVKSNSLIFEYLGILSFTSTMFICAISKPFYEFFFGGEYVAGYIVSPYLFLASLLLMLYQVIANQFLVIKKTWPSSAVLAFGALANIGFNYWLIPILGVEGAGIATLLGYILSILLAAIVLVHMNLLMVPWRFIVSVFITVLYFVLWRNWFIEALDISVILAVIGTLMLASLYKCDIYQILKRLR